MMTYDERVKAAREGKLLKDLVPQFFQFKQDGDTIYGKLMSTSDVTSRQNPGTYKQYVIANDNGAFCFACGEQFDKKVGPLLKVGHDYIWTYHGKRKVGGGRSVNEITCQELPTDEELSRATPI